MAESAVVGNGVSVGNGSAAPARERLLEAAYALFAARGVRDVGIDEVIDRAGVAKATLYRHFPSKDDLVIAFLASREQRWTMDWVVDECTRRGENPEERLLAIFDLFDEWFRLEGYEGCSFVKVLLEMGAEHPAGQASIAHIENINTFLADLAMQAGLRDPEAFARSLSLVIKGSTVQACEGDIDAAARAKKLARLLIDQHR